MLATGRRMGGVLVGRPPLTNEAASDKRKSHADEKYLYWSIGPVGLNAFSHIIEKSGKIDGFEFRQRAGRNRLPISGIHHPPSLANANRYEKLCRVLATVGHCCVPTGQE
jgi:hypothetical protein